MPAITDKTQYEMSTRVVNATVQKIKQCLVPENGLKSQEQLQKLVDFLQSSLEKQQEVIKVVDQTSADIDAQLAKLDGEPDDEYAARLKSSHMSLSHQHKQTLRDLEFERRAHEACHKEVHRLRVVLKAILDHNGGETLTNEAFARLRNKVVAKLDKYLQSLTSVKNADEFQEIIAVLKDERNLLAELNPSATTSDDTEEQGSANIAVLYEKVMDLERKLAAEGQLISESESISYEQARSIVQQLSTEEPFPCELLEAPQDEIPYIDFGRDSLCETDSKNELQEVADIDGAHFETVVEEGYLPDSKDDDESDYQAVEEGVYAIDFNEVTAGRSRGAQEPEESQSLDDDRTVVPDNYNQNDVDSVSVVKDEVASWEHSTSDEPYDNKEHPVDSAPSGQVQVSAEASMDRASTSDKEDEQSQNVEDMKLVGNDIEDHESTADEPAVDSLPSQNGEEGDSNDDKAEEGHLPESIVELEDRGNSHDAGEKLSAVLDNETESDNDKTASAIASIEVGENLQEELANGGSDSSVQEVKPVEENDARIESQDFIPQETIEESVKVAEEVTTEPETVSAEFGDLFEKDPANDQDPFEDNAAPTDEVVENDDGTVFVETEAISIADSNTPPMLDDGPSAADQEQEMEAQVDGSVPDELQEKAVDPEVTTSYEVAEGDEPTAVHEVNESDFESGVEGAQDADQNEPKDIKQNSQNANDSEFKSEDPLGSTVLSDLEENVEEGYLPGLTDSEGDILDGFQEGATRSAEEPIVEPIDEYPEKDDIDDFNETLPVVGSYGEEPAALEVPQESEKRASFAATAEEEQAIRDLIDDTPHDEDHRKEIDQISFNDRRSSKTSDWADDQTEFDIIEATELPQIEETPFSEDSQHDELQAVAKVDESLDYAGSTDEAVGENLARRTKEFDDANETSAENVADTGDSTAVLLQKSHSNYLAVPGDDRKADETLQYVRQSNKEDANPEASNSQNESLIERDESEEELVAVEVENDPELVSNDKHIISEAVVKDGDFNTPAVTVEDVDQSGHQPVELLSANLSDSEVSPESKNPSISNHRHEITADDLLGHEEDESYASAGVRDDVQESVEAVETKALQTETTSVQEEPVAATEKSDSAEQDNTAIKKKSWFSPLSTLFKKKSKQSEYSETTEADSPLESKEEDEDVEETEPEDLVDAQQNNSEYQNRFKNVMKQLEKSKSVLSQFEGQQHEADERVGYADDASIYTKNEDFEEDVIHQDLKQHKPLAEINPFLDNTEKKSAIDNAMSKLLEPETDLDDLAHLGSHSDVGDSRELPAVCESVELGEQTGKFVSEPILAETTLDTSRHHESTPNLTNSADGENLEAQPFEENINKSNTFREDSKVESAPVVSARTAKELEPCPMSQEEIDAILSNPYIPESVKTSIVAMKQQNDDLKEQLEDQEKENETLAKIIEVKDSLIDDLKEENVKWENLAKELQQENKCLETEVQDLKIDDQKAKTEKKTMDARIVELERMIPELHSLVAEKNEVLDLEALDLITRLKKIWKELMVLYVESKDMPNIQPITEVDFILDQIDVSVMIVGSALRVAQNKEQGTTQKRNSISVGSSTLT